MLHRRLLARSLSITLVISMVGCNTSDRSTSDGSQPAASADSVPPYAPGVDSTIPVPTTLPPGTVAVDRSVRPPALPSPVDLPIDEVAGADQLAALFDAPNADRAAGMLVALERTGVSVLDIGSDSIATGSGPSGSFGVPWTMVWAVGAGPSVSRVRLDDIARMFFLDLEAPTAPPAGDLGAILLADLRTMAVSDRPTARFAAALVGASARLRGVEILDPATTPEMVYLDGPTMFVLAAVVFRDMVVTAAANGAGAGPSGFVNIVRHRAQRFAGAPCSDDNVDNWISYLGSKAGGGVSVLGVEFEGLMTQFFEGLGLAGAAIAKVLGRITAAMTGIFTTIQLNALQAVEWDSGGILERSKTVRDGEEGEASVVIVYNYDESTLVALNCLAAMLAPYGNNSFLPKAGPVEGVEVWFELKKGFGDFILTTRAVPNHRDTTDAGGQATLPLLGKGQKKDLPEDVDEEIKEYTVGVSAQPDPVTGSSLLKMFFDDLICVASVGFGCADAIADLVKTMHKDLGTFAGQVRDWKKVSYRVDQKVGETSISGIVCSLDQPFTLTASYSDSDGTYEGAMNFLASAETAELYEYVVDGTITVGDFSGSVTFEGKYSIDTKPDNPVITFDSTSGMADTPFGPMPTSTFMPPGVTITLIPDPAACPD
jgi:hypothetical protein